MISLCLHQITLGTPQRFPCIRASRRSYFVGVGTGWKPFTQSNLNEIIAGTKTGLSNFFHKTHQLFQVLRVGGGGTVDFRNEYPFKNQIRTWLLVSHVDEHL